VAESYAARYKGCISTCPGLRDRILSILQERGWTTRAALVAALGVRPSRRTTVYDYLTKLEAEGRVRRSHVSVSRRGRPFTFWGLAP
jgi:predicted ArsR family transcriptional regulator